MPDAEYQDRNIRSARYQLDGFYHDRPGTYVSGNTVIYYEQGNPRRNVSPDCYVAFNVDYSVINYHGSYWVWEMGKPPDFVLEVASESTAGNDTGRKMLIYASMGAGEYWLFDRTVNGKHYGFRMAGYYLGPEGYEPFCDYGGCRRQPPGAQPDAGAGHLLGVRPRAPARDNPLLQPGVGGVSAGLRGVL